jgi:hypothetical protein
MADRSRRRRSMMGEVEAVVMGSEGGQRRSSVLRRSGKWKKPNAARQCRLPPR